MRVFPTSYLARQKVLLVITLQRWGSLSGGQRIFINLPFLGVHLLRNPKSTIQSPKTVNQSSNSA